MRKKGSILTENVVFIILNLIYLTILVVFLLRYSTGLNLVEESYSKQIALILDSAKPGMEIYLNMEDALNLAKEKWGEIYLDKIIQIRENIVTVKLSEKSGHSYSFFNDIEIKNYYYNKKDGYVFRT